ncbi:MAG: hypothetical protein ACFE0O_15205 [Opitutales bacterium]
MVFLFVATIVLAAAVIVLVALVLAKQVELREERARLDQFKREAVEHGFADWEVADPGKGSAVFRWKPDQLKD